MKRKTQIVNGVTYVYDYFYVWDEKTQSNIRKRKYLGKLIDGDFVPNRVSALEDKLEEKERLEPQDVFGSQVRSRACGATALLLQLAKKFGVLADLEQAFPVYFEQILSLGMYLGLEFDRPLNRFHRWALTHEHPYGRDISDEEIINLFENISQKEIDVYLLEQWKRKKENKVFVHSHRVLTSMIETSALAMEGVDNEQFPWLNLATVSSSDGIPFSYELSEESLKKAENVQRILTKSTYAGRKITWVGDCDEGLLVDYLLRESCEFVVNVNRGSLFEELMHTVKLDGGFQFKDGWTFQEPLQLYSRTFSIIRKIGNKKRKVWIHCFSQPTEEMRQGDYSNGKIKYFHTMAGGLPSKWGVRFIPDSLICSSKDNKVFMLASVGYEKPFDAMNAYRKKDFEAALFSNIFEKFYLRPFSFGARVPENIRNAQIFLEFLGLVFFNGTRRLHSLSGLYSEMFHTELLDELDKVMRFSLPGKSAKVSTLTPWQEEIYSKLGIKAPGRR